MTSPLTNSSSSDRYVAGDYFDRNPDWHEEDSPWKSRLVLEMMAKHQLTPTSICDIGCGVGDVLYRVCDALPTTVGRGYDVSPQAHERSKARSHERLSFHLEDLLETGLHFDLSLVMDVVEHVEDPFDFLRKLGERATWHILHIPLAVTVSSSLRPKRLVEAWHKVGHIHLFTWETALATVEHAGLEVVDAVYTRGWYEKPSLPLRTRLTNVPRRLLSSLSDQWAARLLGGYSILILAKKAG